MIKNDEKSLSETVEDNAEKITSVKSADAAEAENEIAAELGKFESIGALMAAYKSLEAEFTRRSQRLKEFEEENKAREKSGCGAPSRGSDEIAAKSENIDDSVKNAIIEEYLKTVASGKSVPLIVGGVSSAAPGFAPRTLKEAGALAERFLKN